MDANTEMDALLRAVRERQQSSLEAEIDVAARLSEFKANSDDSWWDELEEYREVLIPKTTRALNPSWWRVAEDRGLARDLVDRTYRDALNNLPELLRLAPANRRRWLLNRTLEQIAEVIEERTKVPAPRLPKHT